MFFLYLTQVEIMIPIVEQVEEIMEDCTYNNLSAEEWANQAEELEIISVKALLSNE